MEAARKRTPRGAGLMRSGTIRPNRRGVDNITLPVSPQGEYGYTWEWSGVGQYGHMVTPGSGSGGNQVDVPAGAFLKLRAYRMKEAPPGSGGGASKQYARGWNYKYANDQQATAYGSSPAFNVAVAYDIEPIFTVYAPQGFWTHRVSSGDGGYACIGAESHPGGGKDYGGLFESVTTPALPPEPFQQGSLLPAFTGTPGYQLGGWNGNFTYSSLSGAASGAAAGVEMLTLVPEVVVDGGGGTPAEAGHIIGETAKKYYSPLGTEYVELEVAAHVGFYFTHWSGQGVAFIEDTHEHGQPDLSNPLPLDDPEAPVTDTLIWVAMEGSAGGGGGANAQGSGGGMAADAVREVRAVIAPGQALLVEGGHTSTSQGAQSGLEAMNYVVTTMDRPEKAELLAAIRGYQVFVFSGHGGSSCDTLAIDCCITDPDSDLLIPKSIIKSADVEGTGPYDYRLVFLNCCHQAGSPGCAAAGAWQQAFSADCVIAWYGSVKAGLANKYSGYFWQELQRPRWTAKMADESAQLKSGVQEGVAPYTVCQGDTRLR
jgi:hypothetical protein